MLKRGVFGHGLTVGELKEMTRARLAKEADIQMRQVQAQQQGAREMYAREEYGGEIESQGSGKGPGGAGGHKEPGPGGNIWGGATATVEQQGGRGNGGNEIDPGPHGSGSSVNNGDKGGNGEGNVKVDKNPMEWVGAGLWGKGAEGEGELKGEGGIKWEDLMGGVGGGNQVRLDEDRIYTTTAQ